MLREIGGPPGRVPGFAGLRRARSARRDHRCGAADAAGAAWQAEAGTAGERGRTPLPAKAWGRPVPLSKKKRRKTGKPDRQGGFRVF